MDETPRMGLSSAFDDRFLLEGFRQLLPVGAGVEARLRGVVEEVLAHPGSLVRARLAYGIQRRRGVEAFAARSLAIAVEYFHTASLIFDDMPAMDDATERRGHACPHVAYGEAAATLGALAFVNQGYALLWGVLADLEAETSRRAAALVASCLGLGGILNGQAHDLRFAGRGGEDEVLRVAEGKTVSLIRLTLILPALVAGAGEAPIERLDRLAFVWGLAYQILDDFKDCLMSRGETGKSTRRDQQLGRPNLPRQLGAETALARLSAHLDEGRAIVAALAAADGRWRLLEDVHALLAAERRKVEPRLALAACA